MARATGFPRARTASSICILSAVVWITACGGPRAIPSGLLRACDAAGSRCEDVRVDPQPDAVVFLVGDAGGTTFEENPLLQQLRLAVAQVADRGVPTTVTFLGDNVYDVGVREGNDEDLRRLDAQVNVVRGAPGTQGLFLPGNHGWAGHRDSVAVVCRQARVLAETDGREAETSVRMSPVAAIGPDTFPVLSADGERLASLVTIDSQLWFTGSGEGQCPNGRRVRSDVDASIERLRAVLAERQNALVIVAAHHPLVTGGVHGGGGNWLGRFLYLTRLSPQDLHAGPYAEYAEAMEAILADHPGPVLYAAGHDHSMQLQSMGAGLRSWYHLVSGSGSKQSEVGELVGDDLETLFAAPLLGYARVDVREGQPALLTIFVICSGDDVVRSVDEPPMPCDQGEAGQARPVFSIELR
jgi:hypothetical protein